jgi:hypothetical protein
MVACPQDTLEKQPLGLTEFYFCSPPHASVASNPYCWEHPKLLCLLVSSSSHSLCQATSSWLKDISGPHDSPLGHKEDQGAMKVTTCFPTSHFWRMRNPVPTGEAGGGHAPPLDHGCLWTTHGQEARSIPSLKILQAQGITKEAREAGSRGV